MSIGQLEDRRGLSTHFDDMTRTVETAATQGAMDRFGQEAFEFISGPTARRAFDIGLEDPRCATATAGTAGAKAVCWRGGWSKPAPRSSPSTSAAGITIGI